MGNHLTGTFDHDRVSKAMDLLGGTRAYRDTDPTTGTDIVKGKGPPAGYQSVGAHGGYRKRVGAKWRYWYPDTATAEAAIQHHNKQVKDNAPTGWSSQDSGKEGQRRASLRSEHAEHLEGTRNYLADQRHKERLKREKAGRDATPKTQGHPRGGAEEGKHRLADRDGYRDVDTVHSAGHFHVAGSAVQSGTSRGNSIASYNVTHGPTGLNLGNAKTKAQAKKLADHYHRVAGDAGKDATFGDAGSLTQDDMDRMRAAHNSFKKSMDGGPDQFVMTQGSHLYVDFNIAGRFDPGVIKSQRPSGQPARPLDGMEWGHLWDQG